jgi:hypothetical protein
MHGCSSMRTTVTSCGLGDVVDVDVVAGHTSVCTTCFPRDMRWHGLRGMTIMATPSRVRTAATNNRRFRPFSFAICHFCFAII